MPLNAGGGGGGGHAMYNTQFGKTVCTCVCVCVCTCVCACVCVSVYLCVADSPHLRTVDLMGFLMCLLTHLVVMDRHGYTTTLGHDWSPQTTSAGQRRKGCTRLTSHSPSQSSRQRCTWPHSQQQTCFLHKHQPTIKCH